jgi:hypothetical protein
MRIPSVWMITALSSAILACAPLAGAAVDRALAPIAPRTVLRGTHRSACEPMRLHGHRTYTRLSLRFSGKKYASSETLYSDPDCEISVLQTRSEGTWSITRRKVLNLHLARMQMRPLDPRMADRLAAARSCGKNWENGGWNEILGTSCSHGHLAEYFVGRSPSGKSIELYECEGRRSVGKDCTHYEMARADRPSRHRSRK